MSISVKLGGRAVHPHGRGSAEAARRAQESRRARAAELRSDPFLGSPSLDQALEEAKCTTQAEALARLLNRENVFISGLAGAGKTTVVNRFAELLDSEFDGRFNVALTASTGIAATLIGGQTIHSFMGIGISEEPFNIKNKNSYGRNIWSRLEDLRGLDVLVIDEISMLPGHVFTKVDAVLKWARRNKKPFGGVQLVLLGDFLQLPPVERRGDEEKGIDNRFAIETDTWKKASIAPLFMDKSYRAQDEHLQLLLREMANGKVSEASRARVLARTGRVHDEGKIFTTLYTTNANVDNFNQRELDQNPNPIRVFRTKEEGSSEHVKKAYKQFGIPEEIRLKKGAKVILTSNYDLNKGLANGSVGVVESFSNDGTPWVRFNSGTTSFIDYRDAVLEETVEATDPATGKSVKYKEPVASLSQLPLKLGYAITVHKSQGQTFDGVTVDLRKCFTDGLGYVALSRVRALDDLVVQGLSERAWRVNPRSRKITLYVKKAALKNRHKFVEERAHYEELLTDPMARMILWPKTERHD